MISLSIILVQSLHTATEKSLKGARHSQEVEIWLIGFFEIKKLNHKAELEIVVELGNLVPRNKIALQKVFVALRYSKKLNSKTILKFL